MASELVRHYSIDTEGTRLSRTPHGRLEFLRTQELIRRYLTAPARVLDVGGGTGVHAEWLAADGHPVHVVDLVPGHIEAAAMLPGVTAQVGDARRLPVADRGIDAVLLLGPLYHLTESSDRATALAEAHRVLRPGGVIAAAAISRYSALLQKGADGTLDLDATPSITQAIATGHYDGHVGFFPTHWHTADELRTELEAAGFEHAEVYGIEGPAWPALDLAGVDAFDVLAPAALRCARLVERDPHIVNASTHLLAFAHT
ncbi:class I SAM-dependent methyltransferase [Nocardia terpenica]|uniref:Methyltransferase domain-containing protein n=1 Tax=Nocardia terpenica TaxID=455432 RepID=A0A6G9Z128_9NOCA|nr:class I SAM-dependent methyltransferase [Nocardia terpenica]QIS19140.1 methyltransferase domain-containing protein [Nocardia terpenica]